MLISCKARIETARANRVVKTVSMLDRIGLRQISDRRADTFPSFLYHAYKASKVIQCHVIQWFWLFSECWLLHVHVSCNDHPQAYDRCLDILSMCIGIGECFQFSCIFIWCNEFKMYSNITWIVSLSSQHTRTYVYYPIYLHYCSKPRLPIHPVVTGLFRESAFRESVLLSV